MVWIYQVLEVHDRKSRPLGKYRLVRWADETPEQIAGLCEHSHATPEEAIACVAANRVLDIEFRERISMPGQQLHS